MSKEQRHWLNINRAPVLTLWAAIVAERLGFNRDESLTLGRAVAGLNAYSKGKALGLFKPTPAKVKEQRKKLKPADAVKIDLLGRAVDAVHTDEGLRALSKNKPITPESVEKYLFKKFGDALDDARSAMEALAKSYSPGDIAREGYNLYADFRPAVEAGVKGWGAEGRLSLDQIRELSKH
jgi:hypothetical protein